MSMSETGQEYELHERILDGDPTAFAELAELLYSDLVTDTQRRAGMADDPALVEEAVGQALLDYQDAPHKYDSARSPLRYYLVLIAYHDYLDMRKKELRRTTKESDMDDERFANISDNHHDTLADDIHIWMQVDELITEIAEKISDPTDWKFVLLILQGVRESSEYAHILGIEHQPKDIQVKEINRVKNRISKRLRRIGEKYNGNE
jgi:DNA-directed RNA polymerase specialized sigma24 family protein